MIEVESIYDKGMYDQPSAVGAAMPASTVTGTMMILHQAYEVARKYEFLLTNCKRKTLSAQIVAYLNGASEELLEYLDDVLLMRTQLMLRTP